MANTHLRNKGFTLIELMTVGAIVALLAAIAIPSYDNFIKKSRRSSAKSILLEIAAKQENYFADHKRYAASAASLGYPANPLYIDGDGNVAATSQADSTYSVTVSQTNTFDFTATATATAVQAGDSDCASFSIDNRGSRSATHTDCW